MAPKFDDVLIDRDGDVGVLRWVGSFNEQTPGWSRWDLTPDSTPRCVFDFCATGTYGVLVPAVMGAWWSQTQGLARFVVPHWDGVSVCDRLEIPYASVAWEYGIEESMRDWSKRDLGFVQARSYLRGDRDGRVEHSETARAALVPVSTWADLIRVLPVGDQFNTTSLFAVPVGNAARSELIDRLNATEPPRLSSLLSDASSSFAVITQDDDQSPPLDSVVIAGHDVATACAAEHVELLKRRIERYLAETAAAATDDQWNDAVARLAGVESHS